MQQSELDNGLPRPEVAIEKYKMRIAFLTPEYVTPASADGGLANYLKKTALALAERGCQLWVFLSSDRDATWQDGPVTVCEVRSTNNLFDVLNKIPGVRIFTPAFCELSAAKALACRFWLEHENKPFDIIQVPSFRSSGYYLLGNGRVPVVCRISSYTPLWRSAYGRHKSPYEYLTDRFELHQVVRADACFVPSRLLAEVFRQVAGCEPLIIRTPVDSNILPLDTSYFNAHRPGGRYFLFFGTLSRIKGIDLLTQALPPLLEKYLNLSCILIGRDDGFPGGRKIFADILDHCENYRDRLHYHQALPKPLLYPFVQHAEAVLVPSRIDNYPNVCLEAQQFGKPVIGTYGSSLEEMVKEGKTGFLADYNNAESLRQAMERCLLLNDNERRAMTLRIFDQTEKMKHEDRIGQLMGFYKKAIQEFKAKTNPDKT